MATLGTKQMGGKINKQDILGTPVPQVCAMIEEPPAGPLALRLSSQLLYGIALIYGQQIKYLLADVAGVKTQIMSFEEGERKRRFFAATSVVDLVTSTGKRRRGHEIVLQNDPAFNLDFFLLPGPPKLEINLLAVEGEDGETRNYRRLQCAAADVSLQTAVDDITLLNESIEQIAADQRDFLGSFLYEDERGYALDNAVLGFNFGADGELINDKDGENMLLQEREQIMPAAGEKPAIKSGHNEYDFDLPETNDDMAVYDGAHVLYEPGASSMDLDELRTAALNGQLDNEGFPLPATNISNASANIDVAAATVAKQGSKRRRVCEFDVDIDLPIDALRDFRDNYRAHMLAAAARRRQAQALAGARRHRTVTFSKFFQLAVGDPVYSTPTLARLFTSHGNLIHYKTKSRRNGENTPPPIEFGRAGSHPESAGSSSIGKKHRTESASPSIPLSGSSPSVRGGSSSRMLPALPTSDLDLIPELPQDANADADDELHQNLVFSFPGHAHGRGRGRSGHQQPLYTDNADIDPGFDISFSMSPDAELLNHGLDAATANHKRNTEREATVLFLSQLAPQNRMAIKSFAKMFPPVTSQQLQSQKWPGARRIEAAAGFAQLLKMLSTRRAHLIGTEENDILFTV
jgi:hypothetical protein